MRVGGLEKLNHRILGPLHLAGHASAGIENHAERYGGILAGKRLDLFFRVAFEKLEVLFLQAGNKPVHGISNGDRHQHQIHSYFQRADVGIQGSGDDGLLGDLFRLCFIRRRGFAGLDVDIVQISLRPRRRRQSAAED